MTLRDLLVTDLRSILADLSVDDQGSFQLAVLAAA